MIKYKAKIKNMLQILIVLPKINEIFHNSDKQKKI